MGWFKNLFKTIGNFFKTVAITAIGQAAEQVQELAIEVVESLANQDIDSSLKRDMAVTMIKARVPNIATAAINLAIEMAWAIVSDRLKNIK